MGNSNCCSERIGFGGTNSDKARSENKYQIGDEKEIIRKKIKFRDTVEVGKISLFHRFYKIKKKFEDQYPFSYIWVIDGNGDQHLAKFFDKKHQNKESLFHKDFIFTSVISPHPQILEIKDHYLNELVIIEEPRSKNTLLTEMIAAQDKTIHPISFVIALVTMKQISKILKIMHKYKIFHGNLRPSNIIFQEEKNWNSLKITGFESA